MIGRDGVRAGTIGLLGFLLVVAAIGSRPAGYWASAGYVRQANELIARGAVRLECGVQDRIVVDITPGSPEEHFYHSSFLRADVRAFNDGPDASRTPFLVDGCELRGVDPYYHRVDLPFNRLPRWRGDVLLEGEEIAATLEASGRDQLLQVRHAVDGSDATRAASVSPASEGARTQTPLLHLMRPRGPEVTADFFMVGDELVLADRRDIGSPDHIRVNGFRTPPGRRLRIASGDWLQFGFGAPAAEYTYLAETGERARIASFVRGFDGRVERLYPVPRLRPFLEPLSQAMDGALQTIPSARDGGSRVVSRDIGLTLDRELGDALDRRLAAWCTGFQSADHPRAASLLVMDARSGAVRAMPSCPGEPELEPFEPLSPRARQRFLRNQNLVAHPIGSAGKPFWAAAVASTFPNFLDLEVPAHAAGPQTDALGCSLDAPYQDASHGTEGWVGLEEFLQRSCNRYLIEYATAALAIAGSPAAAACRGQLAAGRVSGCFAPVEEGTDAARLRFCGTELSVAHRAGASVRGGCRGLQLVETAFAPAPALGELANIAWYRDPSPAEAAAAGDLGEAYRRGRYRLDAWTPVLTALAGAGDTAHHVQTSLRFAAISPEATNLGLNTVDELRQDWINLLLGGENSRWSNFQLAEALSRLLSGRSVRGSFVTDSAEQAVDLLAEDLLHSGARRRVLHALEMVAEAGGTAGRLAGPLAALERRLHDAAPGRPYDLYAFAKTGTPAVELFVNGARSDRQGGVLVLGLLAVPRERGRAASARTGDWLSACRLPEPLQRRILEVPRPDAIGDDAVALSIALYVDDLPPGQGASVAVTLAERVLPEIGEYLVQRVREAAAAAR